MLSVWHWLCALRRVQTVAQIPVLAKASMMLQDVAQLLSTFEAQGQDSIIPNTPWRQ